MDTQNHVARSPKVSDASKRGTLVSVIVWAGKQIEGTVRERAGLLLDAANSNGDSGYLFLSRSSVERVKIRDVAQGRVKVLQS